MRMAVVGAGYVGLVTGACFANTGHDVTFVDVDEDRVDLLRRGGCPIFEPGLAELMARNAGAGRIHYTTDAATAYRNAQIIFICVGTPSGDEGDADLSAIWTCTGAIGRVIGEASQREEETASGNPSAAKIVVVKSTVPVGVTHAVGERLRALANGNEFHIANNPEFLKEGAAIADFVRPDRVVVGVEEDTVGDVMRDIYEPFVRQGNPVHVMDVRSSEMVKYASNAMLATKISFINEMASLCEALGADIDNVRRGMCADQRIGNQFLFPGLGFGGSCFPKDVLACLAMGRQTKTPTEVLSGVHIVNQRQRRAFFERIKARFDELGGLAGKTLAVWGVAFKPSTDDIREAPAIDIIRRAAEAGAAVRMYDPEAMANAASELSGVAECVMNPYEAADGADALVICTDWDEFKSPDFSRLRSLLLRPILFDGRNLYRPASMRRLGFEHHSIGRPSVMLETGAAGVCASSVPSKSAGFANRGESGAAAAEVVIRPASIPNIKATL